MNNKEKRICGLVVTYNRLGLLKECLQAILQQTRPVDKLLVVDNCSTDGTAVWLTEFAQRHPVCEVLRLQENMGGAGGFAAGVKAAVLGGTDYTWLMDDDTIASPQALEKLLDLAEEKQAGFVCSKVLWTDGNLHPRNLPGGKMRPLHKGDQVDSYQVTCQCELATFVSVLIPSPVVYRVGLPIKEFFIWCDDVEYTTRISEAGYTNYYCAESEVVHKTGEVGSYSVADALPSMAPRFFYQVRNQCYLKHRHIHNKLRFRLWAWNKLRLMRHRVNKRTDGHKAEFLDAVMRGYRAGLTFYPEIEYITPPNGRR